MGQSRSSPTPQPSRSSVPSHPCRPVIQSTVERLADVEICSVMHFLPVADIVRVARCSTRLLHAASSPFAFHFTPPVVVRYPSPLADDVRRVTDMSPSEQLFHAKSLGQPRRASLFAPGHIPCRLLLTEEFVWLSPADIVNDAGKRKPFPFTPSGVAAFFESKGPILEFEATCVLPVQRRTPQPHHLLLFVHPCLQQLHTINFTVGRPWPKTEQTNRVDPDLFRDLAALPRRHTLTLRVGDHADGFDALAAAPCLTRLDVDDTWRLASKSRLPAIATFPHLLHLAVLRPSLYGASWAQFFSTPLAARLESLELNHMGLPRNRQEDAARDYSAIANMINLRQLQIRLVEDAKFIVPHLVALPRLQLFLLELRHSVSSDPLTQQSPQMFATLLQSSSSPDLRCVIRACRLWSADPLSQHAEAVLGIHMTKCAEKFRQQVNHERFSIEITQQQDPSDAPPVVHVIF